MNKPLISPSVMCAPQWQDIGDVLRIRKGAGVELLHTDVMDGHFVPNLMLGTAAVRQLRRISPIPLDLHLMVERPENMLDWFDIQPGESVSVHVESTPLLQGVLTRIRDRGAHPVAAINPATPVSAVEEVLPDVDGILVMTVNPGFAGQKMIPQTLDKIMRLRSLLDESGHAGVRIGVDGNVSFENAVRMRRAGADVFVCGTASLFSGQGTLEGNIARMRACISGTEEKY